MNILCGMNKRIHSPFTPPIPLEIERNKHLYPLEWDKLHYTSKSDPLIVDLFAEPNTLKREFDLTF